MKQISLFSFLLLFSLCIKAQEGKRIEYLSKGSTTYFDVSAMQAVAQSRLFQRATFLLEKREYHLRKATKLNDGGWLVYYSKNMYSENGGKELHVKPIEGETICSDIFIRGKDGGNFYISSTYYNPPKDLINLLSNEVMQLGYKFEKKENVGNSIHNHYRGAADMKIIIIESRSHVTVNMQNYDPDKVEQEKKQKQVILNKTNDLILHASDYLNGATPQIITPSINDLIKLYNGKTSQFAKNFLSTKGYKYKYDVDHIWEKNTTNTMTYSRLIGGFSKVGLFEFDMEFYDDKTCAALVVQLEKMGYKIKYRNPFVDYQYFFEKEGSDMIFGVTAKSVYKMSADKTYIEYSVSLFSTSAFNSMKSSRKVEKL